MLTLGTLHYDSRTAEAKPSDSKPHIAITTLALMALTSPCLAVSTLFFDIRYKQICK